jgi:hypothetical protein
MTVNEKLVKFDQLIAALETLAAEISARKEFALSDEHLAEIVMNVLSQDDRMRDICNRISQRIGNTTIIKGVARELKPEVETTMTNVLNEKLSASEFNSRLDQLIAIHASGGTIPIVAPEPERRSLEELDFGSVDDIACRFELLSEDLTEE